MRISVVTPNLNGAKYLEQTISSVIAAADRAEIAGAEVEYIVVDGGSTDKSRQIIERYRGRIAHVIEERDRGQYDAIGQGFRVATGDVLAWLNSDDVYLPWALATVASVMDAVPDLEWLTTLTPGAMDEDSLGVRFRSVPGYSARAFREGMYVPFERGRGYGAIQQESSFWRRSLWERAGGRLDPGCRLAGDFELWSRFFAHAPLYAIHSPLALYRYRPGQRSSDEASYLKEAEAVLRRDGRSGWAVRRAIGAIPLAGRLLAGSVGYQATMVIRERGAWKQLQYRFL